MTRVPRFSRGFRLRHDAVRDAWVVLGPERLFQLDAQAAEVLRLVDGERSVAAIAGELAQRYAAPAEAIATDVEEMLADLAQKGAVGFA